MEWKPGVSVEWEPGVNVEWNTSVTCGHPSKCVFNYRHSALGMLCALVPRAYKSVTSLVGMLLPCKPPV